MSDQIYWVLELSVKPGEADNCKALMNEMVAATEANEPDTLSYEWTLSADGTTCHIYERYTDSAASLAHLGTFAATFAERFLAALEPTGFTVYGNPSAELREALGAFGPAYMTPAAGFTR
jgi:quinol monooxygenase YgiN